MSENVEIKKSFILLIDNVISLSKAERLAKENLQLAQNRVSQELYDLCYSNLKSFLYSLSVNEIYFVNACYIVGREFIEGVDNDTNTFSENREYLKSQFKLLVNGEVHYNKFNGADYLLAKQELNIFLSHCFKLIGERF